MASARKTGRSDGVSDAERRAQRALRLQAVTAELARARTPEECARALVDVGLQAMEASAGGVALLREDGRGVQVAAANGYGDAVLRAVESSPLDANVLWIAACRGETHFLPDRDALRALYPDTERHLAPNRQAWAALPLEAGPRVGALHLSWDAPRTFDLEERGFIIALAQVGAQAIARAQLFAAEARVRARAELGVDRMLRLHRVVAAGGRARTPQEVAELMTGETLEALGAARVGLWWQRDVEGPLELAAITGVSEDVRRRRETIAIDETTAYGVATLSREAIFAATTGEAVARFPRMGETLDADYGFAILPFRSDGRAGVLAVAFAGPHPFDEDERGFLLLLAVQCAQALDRAELLRAERAARDQLAFVAEASQVLAGSLELDVTLRRTTELAVSRLCDLCFVDRLEPDGTLRRLAMVCRDPALAGVAARFTRRRPQKPAGQLDGYQVLRRGEPLVVRELTDATLQEIAGSPEHLEALRALAPRSYVSFPLRSRDHAEGLLSFVDCTGTHRYEGATLEACAELARRAALALDNARLYDQVRAQDRAKSSFIAMLGHELRNPLAPMASAARLLQERAGDADLARAAAVVERQTRHLTRLVDDLLDATRLERGSVALRKERVDLRALAATAFEDARPAAADARLRLVSDLPQHPVWVDGDPTRLLQVLAHLLGNGVKFTDPHGTVRLALAETDGRARVEVQDTGVGLDARLLPRLFQPFTQADATLARSQGGLGLGLSLAHGLVQLHGGELTAHSDGPGHGSSFTFALPIAAAPEQRDAPSEPAGAPGAVRVLIVEDNIDAGEMLAELLDLLGYRTRLARTGDEGLREALRFAPDVVLCDLGLPGLDGFEVARRLRADPRTAGLYLVALTGYGQAEDRRRSREAGFDVHLTKPVDPDTLRPLLDRRARAQASATSGSSGGGAFG